MHTIVSVTAKGRCRRGTYSEASAAAFGMAPPRPRPARKRSTLNAARPFANEIANVSAAKAIMLKSSAVRRPIRVAKHSADGAADHHAERTHGQRCRESATLQPPFLHQRRDCIAEQLVVDAIEDDRERCAHNQKLLICGPASFVDDLANIYGNVFHNFPFGPSAFQPGRLSSSFSSGAPFWLPDKWHANPSSPDPPRARGYSASRSESRRVRQSLDCRQ